MLRFAVPAFTVSSLSYLSKARQNAKHGKADQHGNGKASPVHKLRVVRFPRMGLCLACIDHGYAGLCQSSFLPDRRGDKQIEVLQLRGWLRLGQEAHQDENDDSRARENVRNALINNPDLRTLVGIWSYNAPAIVDVVRERKLDKSQYTVVCFDAEPLAIQAMVGNQIDALVVQNPYRMGYDGVRLLHALVAKDQETIASMYPRHGQPDGDLLDTGLKVVVPNDQSPAKSADYGPNVEVLTLESFKGWLEQNGLTGS